MTDGPPERGALLGALVVSFFGAGWACWGAGGASGALAVTIAVVGLVLGVTLAVAAGVQARRPGAAGGPTLFASRRYWAIVLAEAVAIVVGTAVIAAVGAPAYGIAWTALVVGAHFLAFGRVFAAVFTPIGWAMVGAAVVGTVAGLTGGPGAVLVVTGVLCAAILLGSAARTVLAAARR